MRFLFDVFTVSLAAVTAVQAGEFLTSDDPKQDVGGRYIVVMEDGVSASEFSAHRSWAKSAHNANVATADGGEVVDDMDERVFEFLTGFMGYGASLDDATAKQIANKTEVKYVVPDQIVTTQAIVEQEAPPSWGLVRISHQENEGNTYIYDDTAGEGITVYGIDTGIDIKHPEFEDRASWGKNFADSDDADGAGHGTHTASTIVGKTVGVAKKATVIAVKVLGSDGRGKVSDVLAGVEWAAKDTKDNGRSGKSVINLSLGGAKNKAYNDAVNSAADSGIFIAAAAGNDNTDAADYSPASAERACTVAATDKNDKQAEFSNYGEVVDVYAPGVDIVGAVPGPPNLLEPKALKKLSGTSMAAPHVAGVAAYLIALGQAKTEDACDKIKELSTPNVQGAPEGTTNKLLFNGVKK